MKSYGVLFICTGNICRSPTAEGVFRHHLRQKGLSERISCDSAGTHDYHAGEAPDYRAVQMARKRGVEMADLRARRIQKDDFENFDLVLAMDQGHYNIVRKLTPSRSRAALSLFLDFTPDAERFDVPDPYYGGEKEFEYAFDLIEQGVHGLLNHLIQDLKL